MKKKITIIVAALLCAALLISCSAQANTPATTESAAPAAATEAPAPAETAEQSAAPQVSALSGKVQMSGSTSMETIANALAEAFMIDNPEVKVDVQLGGSSVGAQDAMSGKSDIGNVSRELKDEEAAELTANIVAIDGIAVVVNKDNAVKDLTKDQLIQIYTGEIKSWKEVGGADKPIVVIGREASSGTRGAFEELLKVQDKCVYAQELNETGAVKTAVANSADAIGYVSLEALDDTVNALNIDGAQATEEAIKGGSYPLSRPFIMATGAEIRPEVQAFLDFVLSADGQAIVKDNKLITVA